MEASCGNCGNRWELRKQPDEYQDGPRCSECGNRDVEYGGGTSDTPAQTVFAALDEGRDLTSIVRDEGMDPDEVEELVEKYEKLSAYHLFTDDGLQEIRQEAFELGKDEGYSDGREAGIEEGKQIIRDKELGDKVDDAYNRGYNYGYEEGFSDGKQEGFDEGRQAGIKHAEENFAQELGEITKLMEEIYDGLNKVINNAEQRGYKRGYRKATADTAAEGLDKLYSETDETTSE